MDNSHYNLGPEDKTATTMIYTPQRMIWGQLVSKQMIRACTWLQTEMAPNYLKILDAQVLLFGTGQSTATIKIPILHVQKEQIIAYHLLPPSDESPYFDRGEPNRKMEPVTIISGIFRFDGKLRMAENTDLETFLGAQKDLFLPVFYIIMTAPLLPSIKGITFPFAMVKQTSAIISSKLKGSIPE